MLLLPPSAVTRVKTYDFLVFVVVVVDITAKKRAGA